MKSVPPVVPVMPRASAQVAACALLLAGALGASFGSQAATLPWIIPVDEPRDVAFDRHGMAYISRGDEILRVDPRTQSHHESLAVPTSTLLGMASDPQGCRIAIADAASDTDRVHVIDNVDDPSIRTVQMASLSWGAYGGHSLVWVDRDSVLVSGLYPGSGWAELRRVNLASGTTQIQSSVRQNTMLARDDAGRVVLVEANISSGPVSLRDPETSAMRSQVRTNWFTYEVSISPDGALVAVPTYNGTYIFDVVDGALVQRTERVGVYTGPAPNGIAFARETTASFAALASWNNAAQAVVMYPDRSFASHEVIDATAVPWTGNHAFRSGRTVLSRDGKWLAVTFEDAVRIYDVAAHAADPDRIFGDSFNPCD